eukprot:10540213-Alexandrium_andersonii.AAC.1
MGVWGGTVTVTAPSVWVLGGRAGPAPPGRPAAGGARPCTGTQGLGVTTGVRFQAAFGARACGVEW